jgi:hypothetical protein
VGRVRKYLLDANVFIEAQRRYYPFDLCPGFWAALLQQHEKKRILSIDRIKKEIEDGGDELAKWVRRIAPSTFFKKTADKGVIDAFRRMVEWVDHGTQYSEDAKTEFARGADGWLVAYAKTNGLVVVTHEVYDPNIKRRVPIPNLCRHFIVDYVDTFKMLKELGIQFVLQKRK